VFILSHRSIERRASRGAEIRQAPTMDHPKGRAPPAAPFKTTLERIGKTYFV
jgi:hypothetical protein